MKKNITILYTYFVYDRNCLPRIEIKTTTKTKHNYTEMKKKTRKDKEKQKLKIQTENKIHPGDSVVHCMQVHIGFLRYSKLRSRSPDAIVLNIKRY